MPADAQPPPTDLPVDEAIVELRTALAAGSAAVLEASPGAGETTLVPLRLLAEPWLDVRRILMLEPRRLATRAAAARMAELLGETVGGTVGYAMRFDRRLGPGTRIEVVTEGLLTRRLQADPALEAYGLVIFDEFHERSLDADLGLALCLEVQSSLRPDLRLLCMSATLDGTSLARHLGGAPVIRSHGRQHPVTIRHLGGDPAQLLELRVAQAVALAPGSGGILVFLPGAAEIRRTAELLAARLPGTPVHVLYGDLPRAAQDAALRPVSDGGRKVVLATNVAETSLTIEGIATVIDAGLERRSRFSARTGMSRLVTVPISRASAAQRAGRAGRQGPGHCYRLWSVEAERGMVAHRPAEIEEADLAPLALELAAWGLADPARLRLPTQPPAGPFAQGRALLLELGALTADGAITAHGRAMAELPLHPRLAHMSLAARELGLAPTALAVAALLGVRDPDRADADLARRLTLLRPSGEPDRVRRQLARTLRLAVGEPDPEAVGAVTSLAFPDRLAQARPGSRGAYLLANGRGARLDPRDPLAGEPWLAVAELDDAGSEARIRLAASLPFERVEQLHGHRFAAADEVRFEPREAALVARRVLRLGALPIREQPFAPEPALVAAAWCDAVRSQGLPWTEAARQLQGRVALLHRREPTAWPDLADVALIATLDEWLAPHLSTLRRLAEVDALDLRPLLLERLDHAQRRELDRRAPLQIELPSGRQAAIDYSTDPPVLAVRLQELFGLKVTPTIDQGRTALILHLLSPARRPLAITRDLAGFWAAGYPAVRREQRGRYPKHPWPEDPLTAPGQERRRR
ncbi:MAG: ATP-dependent helicase HrpB [Geminicoccaceae bacterium]